MFAGRIAANTPLLARLKALSDAGMPIYAECGGFMILCDYLEMGGARHRMAGVFPVGTTFCPKPQGLGYTEAVAVRENPFYPVGETVLGHEFHYSVCVITSYSIHYTKLYERRLRCAKIRSIPLGRRFWATNFTTPSA